MSHPRRNDPCPCGSGLKYKKCHGAPAPAPAAPTTATTDIRPCGDCSLCCDGWLKTRVLGHDISLGHPCVFSDGHRCTIHETRPVDPCRVFFCGSYAAQGIPLLESAVASALRIAQADILKP